MRGNFRKSTGSRCWKTPGQPAVPPPALPAGRPRPEAPSRASLVMWAEVTRPLLEANAQTQAGRAPLPDKVRSPCTPTSHLGHLQGPCVSFPPTRVTVPQPVCQLLPPTGQGAVLQRHRPCWEAVLRSILEACHVLDLLLWRTSGPWSTPPQAHL